MPEETLRLYKNVMDDVVRALREDLKAQSRFDSAEIEHKLELLRQRWREKLLAQGVDLDAVFVPTAGGSMTAPHAGAPRGRRPALMVTEEGKRKRPKVVKPRATPFLPANGLDEDGSIATGEDEDDEDDGIVASSGVGVSLNTRVPPTLAPHGAAPASTRVIPPPGQIVNPFTQTVRSSVSTRSTGVSKASNASSSSTATARRPTAPAPPQFDGPGDEPKKRAAGKAKSKGKGKAESKTAKKDTKAADQDDDELNATVIDSAPEANEDPLGSDDDDTDDDIPDTENLILCQYERITHVKDKWRLTLSDGIMHINKQDYVFRKATAENIKW